MQGLFAESLCDSTHNLLSLLSALQYPLDKANLTYTDDQNEPRCSGLVLNYLSVPSGPVQEASWPTGQRGCLVVAVGEKATEVRSPLDMDLQLISYEAIIPARSMGCLRDPAGTLRLCRFAFQLSEHGTYNLSMRANDCRVTWYEGQSFLWPMASLGFQYGRYRELRTPGLYSISTPAPVEAAFSNAIIQQAHSAMSLSLPACTFAHEELLRQGIGNPRWRRTPWLSAADHQQLTELWYNDSYSWGNDVCLYKPYSSADFIKKMNRQNMKTIMMIGDSLVRFSFDDMEDMFANVTQQWLTAHPLKFTDESKGPWSNWDGIFAGWIGGDGRESFNCVFPALVGECYRNGRMMDELATSRPNNCQPTVEYEWFAPYGVEPLPVDHYRKRIAAFLARRSDWSMIIFTIGLSLDAFKDPVGESRTIVTAMIAEAALRDITLVWRSAMHHHHPHDGKELPLNPMLQGINDMAISLLVGYNGSFVFSTSYILASLRPDRSSDSFHYRHRKTRRAWHYCDEDKYETQFLPNCIRRPTFPISVTKAMTLATWNYIMNSKLQARE